MSEAVDQTEDAPSRPALRRSRPGDVVATVALLVLLGIFSYFAYLGVVLLGMAVGACNNPGTTCDYDRIWLGSQVGSFFVWGIFAVVLIVSVVRLLLRRRAFWVPLVGFGLVIAVYFVAVAVTYSGISAPA